MAAARGSILVTGGAGYIGSALTRDLLAQGYEVTVLDALLFGGESLVDLLGLPHFSFVRRDVTRADELDVIFAGRSYTAVVHLASLVGDPACKAHPDLATQTIWQGSKNLLDMCEKHSVPRFLFASTCSNYGKMDTDALLTEEAPLRPVSLYAELKVKFEQYLLARDTPVDFTIMRFATVYGLSLRPRFDLTINEFVRDALLRGQLEIYGPEFWRPYCHVRDICGAIALILESDAAQVAGKTFNIGSNDENYQKRMIAEEVKRQIPVELIYVERDEDPRDYRVAFDRLARLGFLAQRRLPDGVAEIAGAIRDDLIVDPYAPRYHNT